MTAYSRENRWSVWRLRGSSRPTAINGFFYAMDTYREYLYLNELWNQDKAPWRIWQ